METTQLGHCPQTDPFDLKETHRDIGTITIVSSTIELGYVHGMACHLRSGTTSWLWRLGTYYVNGPKGVQVFRFGYIQPAWARKNYAGPGRPPCQVRGRGGAPARLRTLPQWRAPFRATTPQM